ncbi:MAG: NAD-dependent epimerase/dehydratase family protein [Bauldia sp.]|uniref:NAD-dependent epimerase/dehydratase family protein n=1 Tax=Bauldia sp. TaxID=2575872 RepID=UPI001D56082E|nr:NAD-dependent epimerase/dehydratase family protein [Bauldia sp.]MCB1498087.1 NAD-dependent epimerase/dehydratase family protein [Bauldia sp.]
MDGTGSGTSGATGMKNPLNPVVAGDLAEIDGSLTDAEKNKFRDSTVLVTGCAGFLGYYFLQYLVRNAISLGIQKVIGVDTFIFGRPAWMDDLIQEFPEKIDLHSFDIAKDDLEVVPGAVKANFVVHMASIASPTFYRQFPLETIDANIWGLRRLLDMYSDSGGLRGFLFFSSSEIYGDPASDAIPTAEEYRGNVSCIGPRACYDESKRFGETICYVYAKTAATPITVARPFNNFGPGMRVGDRRLPADFANCVLEGRDIVILSDGTPTRTFCYVADAVSGYLKCLLHGQFEVFNIGTDKPEIMVRELAMTYQQAGMELFGYSGKVRYETSDDAEYLTDNPNRRCPMIDKARAILQYDPRVDVEEGVRRYLAFLKHEAENRT